MFTGIVETLGVLSKVTEVDQGLRVEISTDGVFDGVTPGDSIAVNGVCLTVVEISFNQLSFDISAETLRRTSLRQTREGARVNLERPVTLASRLGGHLVQGHVDATGQLIEVLAAGEGFNVRIGFPPEFGRYIVEKGSIAVDGISLTVAKLGEDWFEIAIIPHTWRSTNLSGLELGADVNIEVDVIAKYVEKLMRR